MSSATAVFSYSTCGTNPEVAFRTNNGVAGVASSVTILNPLSRGANITYTATNRFAGTDSFTYSVSDNYGRTSTATIMVMRRMKQAFIPDGDSMPPQILKTPVPDPNFPDELKRTWFEPARAEFHLPTTQSLCPP